MNLGQFCSGVQNFRAFGQKAANRTRTLDYTVDRYILTYHDTSRQFLTDLDIFLTYGKNSWKLVKTYSPNVSDRLERSRVAKIQFFNF